jgi:glutaminyl-peptide cyclotransferase
VAFGPRKPGTQAHRDCRDYILGEMEKSCDNVRLQPFDHVWSKTQENIRMWNIIGEQDYKTAPVRIALFAHWDTRPSADQETDPVKKAQPIPGADDGASGVAVLLELMKEMKGKHPGIGVLYVMIDGEDLGPGEDEMYLGAVQFAGHLPSPKPDYGILLDMVGGKNVRIPKEQNSIYGAPTLTKLLYLHAEKLGMSSTFPDVKGWEIDDDHLPIIRAGIPTVDLIDLTYPQWHTLDDTPEHCSPESLVKVGILLVNWLQSTDALAAASK